jgi:hypothetical protein
MAASLLARCAGLVTDGKQAQLHADKAMYHLELAVDLGWNNPKSLDDPAFTSLISREDFAKLRVRIEKASKPKP